MLDYIKSQINSKRSVDKAPTPEEMPDEAILEYARIFQELDDITIEGSDAGKVRKLGMDFDLLDEEITPTTVEFDIESGTLADVKNDATAVVESSYEGMKTYDKFYQEAAEQIVRFPRETDSSYDARVSELADQMYTEYCNDAAEYGYFGFGSISITDESVPSKMNVDFGKFTQESDTSFVGKVGVFFSTDENHNITKKQLDSVNRVKNGAFKNIGAPLRAYMEGSYTIPENVSVWDVCTPRNLIVPKGNGDSFCVVLEYMNELKGEVEYYGWTEPVNPESDTVTQESCVEINKEAFVTESQYENKEKYLKALANAPKPVRFTKRPISRFVQEAIDFGTGDPGSDVDNNAGGGDTTVTTGEQPAGNDTANADGNVATGNSSDAPEGNDTDTANKTDANVNNVSSEIADKVDEIQNNENMNPDTGALEGETITFDDGTSTVGDAGDNNGINEETPDVEQPVDDTGTGTDDMGSDTGDTGDMGASVDDQLADLNATPDEAAGEGEDPIPGVDDEGNIDLDNMTIDQLIEQGSEKLRQMPLGEIKNFLQSGPENPEAVTESFIITTNNVNNEITVRIRECLGILNDSSIDTKKIFNKFAHAGSKLNRVLTKASKMSKIYSTDELASIKKLNTALANLLLAAKKAKKDETANVKAAITEFTKQCKIVSSFSEKKVTGKPVQEAFVQEGLFLSEANAKKRLCKKIPLVYADMAAIVKAQEGGYLTKGKLSKMYKPKMGIKPAGTDATGSVKSFESNTSHTDYLEDLVKISSKILRKEKVKKAFTRDELSTISDLVDNLDDFVDIVEAVIYDNSPDNSTIIEKIVDLAKKIIANLDAIQGTSSGDVTTDSTPSETVDATTADEDIDSTDLGDSDLDSDAELDLDDDDDESNTTDDTPDEDGEDATADTGSDDDSDVDIEGENDTEGEDE